MKSRIGFLLIGCFALFLWLWGVLSPALSFIQRLPELRHLEHYRPEAGAKIFDHEGKLLAEYYLERRIVVPFRNIPRHLVNAFLAIEDKNFYNHFGIDPRGIARAIWKNLHAGRVVQGGSTITQQLVRTLFLEPEVTLTRKLKEAFLALMMERFFSKEEILSLYLNQIYMGSRIYGVEAAARRYFNKGVQNLTLEESALLAGLPKSPSRFSPFRHPDRARKRRNTVLRKMREMGFINSGRAQKAQAAGLGVGRRPATLPSDLPSGTRRKRFLEPSARYFVEAVLRRLPDVLREKFERDELYQKGLRVYTTLDLDLQEAARNSTLRGLEKIDNFRVGGGELEDDRPPAEGALVAMNPRTGAILAMVGGRDYRRSQFNRATQAFRQPGSTFKPFVYAAALEQGMRRRDILVDAPVSYRDPANGKIWRPRNDGNRYYRRVTLQRALEKSLNSATIRLIERVGPQRVYELARRFGIQSSIVPNLSLALGASEVTLAEMVSAYGTIAHGGLRTEPYAIKEVRSSHGLSYYWRRKRVRRVIDQRTAHLLTTMMRGVVKRGTARAAGHLPAPLAGKTGTTDDFRDAWFIGFSPNLVLGVWVGLDSNAPLGEGLSGARAALPIWVGTMSAWLKGHPVKTVVLRKNSIPHRMNALTRWWH